MARTPDTRPNQPRQPETPRDVVNRFKQFTCDPLAGTGKRFFGDLMWRVEMTALYGDQEMFRRTNDVHYRGVQGLDEKLEAAYRNGGLNGLKGEWFAQAISNTNLSSLEGGVAFFYERIIGFE